MKAKNDITELVGNTPMVKLHSVINPINRVYAKLEFYNPTASLKDRAALEMVEQAEASGRLKSGGTIIEATSGNTGIALAFIAAARKYKLTLVMPESMSIERQKLLALLGANLELTPADMGMKGAIDKAQELHQSLTNSILIKQFDNQANVDAHAKHTAMELLNDSEGELDYLFIPVGTGGTLMGCAQTLKKKIPQLKIIAVEPADSPVLSGGLPGPHLIQGIGAPFVPTILDQTLIDGVVTVENDEAFDETRNVCKKEGILAGLTSGAGIAAVNKYVKAHKIENKSIVLFFCDSAERYLSLEKLFQ